MQYLPDKTTLLEALAAFLEKDVRPALSDSGLAFRVRVAAHLAATVAREIATEERHEHAELEELQALLGADAPPPTSASARREALAELTRLLDAKIAGDLDQAEHERVFIAVKASLARKLAVSAPRFDTSLDIEAKRSR